MDFSIDDSGTVLNCDDVCIDDDHYLSYMQWVENVNVMGVSHNPQSEQSTSPVRTTAFYHIL